MSYNIPSYLTTLSNQSASSSASISFTSGISSNFTLYYVKIRNFIPATNNVNLHMLFSTDGGATYLGANYNWGYRDFYSGSSFDNNSGTGAYIQLLDSISNSSTAPSNFDIYLYNLTDSVSQKSYFYDEVVKYGGSVVSAEMGCGGNSGTTAVNAIQFITTSGNIASGQFILYGVTP